MSKVLAFIYDEMADFELTFATHVTGTWMEKELVTVAYEKKEIISKPGIKYTPHFTVKEALELDDVDGIIIPGGWRNELEPELHELLNKLNDDGKYLAAICAGPQYLARTGVLDNKGFTTTFTQDYMKENQMEDKFQWDNYIDEKVVRADNIITAKGEAFIDFAIEILDYYKVFDDPETQVTKEQLLLEYKGL